MLTPDVRDLSIAVRELDYSPIASHDEIEAVVRPFVAQAGFEYLGVGLSKTVFADPCQPGKVFGVSHVLMNPEYAEVLAATGHMMQAIAPWNIPVLHAVHQIPTSQPSSSLGRNATFVTVSEKQRIVPSSAHMALLHKLNVQQSCEGCVPENGTQYPVQWLFQAVIDHQLPTWFFETKLEDIFVDDQGRQWYIDDITLESEAVLTESMVTAIMNTVKTPANRRAEALRQMLRTNKALAAYHASRE